jgi:hypothetical protein
MSGKTCTLLPNVTMVCRLVGFSSSAHSEATTCDKWPAFSSSAQSATFRAAQSQLCISVESTKKRTPLVGFKISLSRDA